MDENVIIQSLVQVYQELHAQFDHFQLFFMPF